MIIIFADAHVMGHVTAEIENDYIVTIPGSGSIDVRLAKSNTQYITHSKILTGDDVCIALLTDSIFITETNGYWSYNTKFIEKLQEERLLGGLEELDIDVDRNRYRRYL